MLTALLFPLAVILIAAVLFGIDFLMRRHFAPVHSAASKISTAHSETD